MSCNPKPTTAAQRALYRNALEEERRVRAEELAAKRAAGVLRGASSTRKRRKHGRR